MIEDINSYNDFSLKDIGKKITAPVKQATGWAKDTIQGKVFDPLNEIKVVKNVSDKTGDVVRNVSDKTGDFIRKIDPIQKIKTVGLAPARSAYLALLRINFLGHADKLNEYYNTDRKRYDRIAKKFYDLGGNRTTFKDVWMKGKKEKPLFQHFNNVTGAEIAGVVASATPILLALVPLFGKKEKDDLEKELPEISEAEMAKIVAETEAQAKKETEEKKKQINIILFSSGGLLIAGIAAYLILKK